MNGKQTQTKNKMPDYTPGSNSSLLLSFPSLIYWYENWVAGQNLLPCKYLVLPGSYGRCHKEACNKIGFVVSISESKRATSDVRIFHTKLGSFSLSNPSYCQSQVTLQNKLFTLFKINQLVSRNNILFYL